MVWSESAAMGEEVHVARLRSVPAVQTVTQHLSTMWELL